MTMLALCLAPVLMICLFFMAVRFNHLFLSLLPLVLLFVLVFHYADLMEQLFFVFVRRCLVWTVLALAAAWFLTRGSSPYVRNILCAAACIAGCAVPLVLAQRQEPQSVYAAAGGESIVEAAMYSRDGGGFSLTEEQLEEFNARMAESMVKPDLMDSCQNTPFDGSHTWYYVNTVLADGEEVRIAFFPKREEPDQMRIEQDGQITCYIAAEEGEDIGSDWINGRIQQRIWQMVRDAYREPLQALKNSLTASGASFTFTIPEGLPGDLEITIIGLPDEKNHVVYFLDEYNKNRGWTAGQQYFFDVSAYGSYRYLYLSASVDGETFGLVNLFDLLPEAMQSPEPQDRFSDAGL